MKFALNWPEGSNGWACLYVQTKEGEWVQIATCNGLSMDCKETRALAQLLAEQEGLNEELVFKYLLLKSMALQDLAESQEKPYKSIADALDVKKQK